MNVKHSKHTKRVGTAGFGLVQAMMIVAIISGISYYVMETINLNNRILQNVSSAKIIDDVVDDLYKKLKDPEICGIDYYVSNYYDDKVLYSKKFNKRLYSSGLAGTIPASPSEGAAGVYRGRFVGLGNFFQMDSSVAKARVGYILNKKGVENFKWVADVSYTLAKNTTPAPAIYDDDDRYTYSTAALNYGTATHTAPGAAPADQYVDYWALPANLNLQKVYRGTGGVDDKYLIGRRVAIKDMYLTNLQTSGGIKTMDLVVVFVKNVNTRDYADATIDDNSDNQRMAELGGRLTRRIIKIVVETFKAPNGVQVGTGEPSSYSTNATIQRCYADRGSELAKLTKFYCEDMNGSFVDGECRGLDSGSGNTVQIRKEICEEMYGTSPSIWDNTNKFCKIPACRYGVTGFTATGVPKCLCNVTVESNVNDGVTRNTDGTANCP